MSNTVELIPQDKSNACWLASSSMMETWKTGTHHSLTDTLMVLDGSGTSFSSIYYSDKGLAFSENQIITQTLGLTQLPPASYTIEYLTSILDISPIMAVIMFSSSSNIAHMLIITGISGDGTPEGTTLQINDPLPLNSGNTYTIAFNDFLSKFEQVVAYENNFPNTDLTSQLFYFQSAGGSSDTSGGSDGNSSDKSNQPDSTNTSTDDSKADNTTNTSTDDSQKDDTSNKSADDSQTDDTSNTATDDSQKDNKTNTSTDDSQTNN